jgi:N-acetylglucosaminyl-diphospho-decaprenol L-rhamnosyltransferase
MASPHPGPFADSNPRMTTGSAHGTERSETPGRLGASTAELSVLIVNYNTWRECAQAVATLRQFGPTRPDGSPMPFECLVVDNHSPQRDPAQIAAVEHELRLLADQQGDPLAGRLIQHHENGGYSKGMNLAAAQARGRWFLVSNPDVLFGPGLIPALQRHLEQDPRAGCVVPKGFWDAEFAGHLPPNTLPTLRELFVTTLGQFVPWVGHAYGKRLAKRWVRVWTAEQPLPLPMMSGCMFLVERAFFEAVGRFDERYPLYYEDTDLSVTMRKHGRTVTQVPDARLVHFVNRSGMSDLEAAWQRHLVSRRLYFAKWYGWLGPLALRAVDWLLHKSALRGWKRFRYPTPLIDLGSSDAPPRLEFGRHCDRYVVLMSLDPNLYLAAGMLGSGDHWTPSASTFQHLVHAVFYFAAYDLSGGRFERLGTWRYHCQSHLGTSVAPKAGSP